MFFKSWARAALLATVGVVGGAGICAAEPARNADKTAPPGLVRRIKIVADKAPDCTSLKSIVASVTRGCKSNDEKALAIYNFMRLTHYHRQYPGEAGGTPVLKEIHCYGWSLCGGLHAEQSALWRELGWNWRFVGWPGHTTVEAYYDKRWHYLDVFLKFYAWMPDPKDPKKRTIAGQDDIAANPKLLDAFVFDNSRHVFYAENNQFELLGDKANWQAPALLVCGDSLNGMLEPIRRRNRVGASEGWGGIRHAAGSYSADVNLAPGFALTNSWAPTPGAWYWANSRIAPSHTCGDKEIRNSPEKGPIAEPYLAAGMKAESYGNGEIVFRPDLSSPAGLRSFAAVENVKVADNGLMPAQAGQPARVTVLLQSPYVLTRAGGSARGVDKLEVSLDDGKTWKSVELKDFGAAVRGQLRALLRLTIADRLQDLQLHATVQNNPFALPFLSPGKNTIAVSAVNAAALGENKLVITHAYCLGARRKSYEQLYLEGKEIARAHDAVWDKKPIVVQKVFAARDLPAKFDIDVPTPKDKYPVYPRMLFVRREVIGPKQKPLPLPGGAQPPRLGPNDELKTLPDPLRTGIQPPPPRATRPVKTIEIELSAASLVTKSGHAPAGEMLRWPKRANEKVEPAALLVGGELKGLPALKDLASARLVFPALRAHSKAPTRVGAAPLKEAFEPGKPYDFAKIGDLLGSDVLPKMADEAANWAPPRIVKLDVTRAVRILLANRKPFHGFAVRVVPDRGVDDGWTVRVQVPKHPKVYLEVDVYAAVAAK